MLQPGRPLQKAGAPPVSSPPLPLGIEEHKTSHVVTWASFKNRAVGIGLPETQSTIIVCRNSTHLPAAIHQAWANGLDLVAAL